jgi:hypothetical protein
MSDLVGAVTDRAVHAVVPTIIHLVGQDAARPPHVERLEQRERRSVLHVAAVVSRRQVDIGNHGVPAVARIQLTGNGPPELFVSSNVPEGSTIVRERPRVDRNARDMRFRRRGAHEQCSQSCHGSTDFSTPR